MASKRQFHADVLKSDAFLDLSDSAKLLYIYFSIDADNTGLSKSMRIPMFNSHAKQEHLDELIRAGFILDLQDGVYAVTHWRVNNDLKNDRDKTTFESKFSMLIEKDKVYYLRDSIQNIDDIQTDSKWIPNDIQMDSKRIPNVSAEQIKQNRQEEREQNVAEQNLQEERRHGGEKHTVQDALEVLTAWERYFNKKITFTDEQLSDFADMLPAEDTNVDCQEHVYQVYRQVGNGKISMSNALKPFEVFRNKLWCQQNTEERT